MNNDDIERRWANIFRRSLISGMFVLALFIAISYWASETYIGCTVDDLAMQTTLPVQNSFDESVTEENNAEKIVYLTFDDGPSKTTEYVLEVLKEQGIAATFFVMSASNNEQYLPLISQIVNDGHIIGLHTCSHVYEDIYSSSEAFWKDIDDLKSKIEPYGATNFTLLRFPGGSSNTVSREYSSGNLMESLKLEATEKGYTYFDWNIDARDAVGGSRDAQSVYNRVIKQAQDQNKCIVLMHDTMATQDSAKALPDIISWFKNAGYTFDTLDNYI